MDHYDLYVNFDGGCWPNPGGEATWAFIIKNSLGRTLLADSGCLEAGGTSNNVAECVAASEALQAVKMMARPGLLVRLAGDSRICLNKIATSRPGKGLFAEALAVSQFLFRQLVESGVKIKPHWIPREENMEADSMT